MSKRTVVDRIGENGNKTNNSPDNLELWSTSQPSGQRVADKLDWARKIIKLYE